MANIIVTGSSRGIGFELVKILAGEGHKVLALSRNERPVQDLKLPNITTFPFDISYEGHLQKLRDFIAEEWEKVDVLVNNAGKFLKRTFMETTAVELEEVYRVNVFGVANITKTVLPFMDTSGHVLTISSMGGVQGSVKFPGLAAYSSSKAAVIGLTELWAEEFKENGPSFNVMALGAVQTEMLEEAFPGYQAPVSAHDMAMYIKEFALNGQKMYNGKLLQVSKSTP
ncbi:MAG: SDR family oxidoreductase [Sediminicola sp.]|tara:strand:+ start:61936 stop:62616 length:681 start_codon:yes stop_codon:yes gene_type:complete